MSNERMMILKMLSEGKITLEEADGLLEALGEGELELPNVDQVDSTDYVDEFDTFDDEDFEDFEVEEDDDQNEEILSRLEDKLDMFSDELDDLEDKIDDELDDLEDKLDEISEMDHLDQSVRSEMERKVKDAYEQLEARREKIRDRRKELKKQRKEYRKQFRVNNSTNFDFQSTIDDISKHFHDFKDNFSSETMEDIKSTMKDIAGQIKEGMKELKYGFNEGSKEIQKAFHGKDFKQMFNNLFKTIGLFPKVKFEKTVTGTFDLSQGPVTVDLKTANGRIEVIGSDEPGYKLNLTYQVSAENDTEAEAVAKEMSTLEQTSSLLKFETHSMGQGSVSAQLYVPKNQEGNFKLKTSNGRITVRGLKSNGILDLHSSNGQLSLYGLRVQEINGHTSNGRIEVKDFVANNIDAHTSNGSIYIDGLCENVIGKTSNGTITVNPYVSTTGSLDLSTSNGRIKVMLKDTETAVDIYARTSMGSVSFDIPNLVFETRVEKNMRKEYQAHSDNYIGNDKRLQINAVTSMGSIYVGAFNSFTKPEEPEKPEPPVEPEEF